MEQSTKHREILELGKKIVEEFGLQKTNDTLGRWMAHYIAELIERVERVGEEERPNVEKECVDAILKLWEHRFSWHKSHRPLVVFEKIAENLEGLNPDRENFYYRNMRRSVDDSSENDETQSLLELIDGVDNAAKQIINMLYVQAAGIAVDQSKDWVELARKAGVGHGVDFDVATFIEDESEVLKPRFGDLETKEKLLERIKKLDAFTKMAMALSEDLKGKVEEFQD